MKKCAFCSSTSTYFVASKSKHLMHHFLSIFLLSVNKTLVEADAISNYIWNCVLCSGFSLI